MNPTGEKWMDGITLSPHELMFVKVKDYLRLSTNSLAITASKYSDWMDGMVSTQLFFVPPILQWCKTPSVYAKTKFLQPEGI